MMNLSFRGKLSSLLICTACALASATDSAATPTICGDVDSSGSVSTADALRVLREAVGIGGELVCPCGVQCPVTTTSMDIGDQCFEDADCLFIHPGWHCGGSNGSTCVECQSDTHCPEGFVCAGFACAPE
jgi:Cys-rich repeat protein